jgi:hypothetical protein
MNGNRAKQAPSVPTVSTVVKLRIGRIDRVEDAIHSITVSVAQAGELTGVFSPTTEIESVPKAEHKVKPSLIPQIDISVLHFVVETGF